MSPIRPLIKVCGMRVGENIRAVEALGIDMMGFIFWPKSSRFVSRRPDYLPTQCKRVGVFVDEDIEQVRRMVDDYGLSVVQLHGHESPDFVRQLRSLCGDSIAIIKAISVSSREDIAAYKDYAACVDYFLFDTKGKSVGGNGEKFDWSVLEAYKGDTPFLLSGGIGPEDVEDVKCQMSNAKCSMSDVKCSMFNVQCSMSNVKCIGIDLNSRFEMAPALKDVAALRRFLSQIAHSPYEPHSPHNPH